VLAARVVQRRCHHLWRMRHGGWSGHYSLPVSFVIPRASLLSDKISAEILEPVLPLVYDVNMRPSIKPHKGLNVTRFASQG
jgi:hypothetical protein